MVDALLSMREIVATASLGRQQTHSPARIQAPTLRPVISGELVVTESGSAWAKNSVAVDEVRVMLRAARPGGRKITEERRQEY